MTVSTTGVGTVTTGGWLAEGGSTGLFPPTRDAGPDPFESISFEQQRVEFDGPAPGALYTWTTEEQYDELRTSDVLLTRSARPGAGGGLLRDKLEEAAGDDPIAALFAAPLFDKARYAWPNPWATVLGLDSETYGTRLIRVTLDPSAWILEYKRGRWNALDIHGSRVSLDDVQAQPERIGAIFHVHEGEQDSWCGSFGWGGRDTYREYFLPNETMIETWSTGTKEILGRLDADIALLSAYSTLLADHGAPVTKPEDFVQDAACVYGDFGYWSHGGTRHYEEYLSAAALVATHYMPTAANIDALVEALEAVRFEIDPIERPQL